MWARAISLAQTERGIYIETWKTSTSGRFSCLAAVKLVESLNLRGVEKNIPVGCGVEPGALL